MTCGGQAGDDERLVRLREIGRRMIEAAGGDDAPPVILQWAAYLDWTNYSIHTEGEQHLLRVNIPENVTKALVPGAEYLDHRWEMYRLLNRYRPRRVTPYRFALADLPSDQKLADDFACARRLEGALHDAPYELSRTLAGVAAAILHKASLRTTADTIPRESIDWSLQLLIHSATNAHRDGFDHCDAIVPDGGDRQAALALPLVFLHADNEEVTPPPALEMEAALEIFDSSLAAGSSSPSLEVRHNAAAGLRFVYEEPCEEVGNAQCWHESVWQAIEAGARSVVLGQRSEDGQRQIELIPTTSTSALRRLQIRI